MASTSADANYLRSGQDLRKRADRLTNELFLGFMRILEHAVVERTELAATSQNQYQLQVDTAKLVRTAEDVMSLTRRMQELWLQGKLDTLRGEDEKKDEGDAALEADVQAVGLLLDDLVRQRDGRTASSSQATAIGEQNGAGAAKDAQNGV